MESRLNADLFCSRDAEGLAVPSFTDQKKKENKKKKTQRTEKSKSKHEARRRVLSRRVLQSTKLFLTFRIFYRYTVSTFTLRRVANDWRTCKKKGGRNGEKYGRESDDDGERGEEKKKGELKCIKSRERVFFSVFWVRCKAEHPRERLVDVRRTAERRRWRTTDCRFYRETND